jgi:hypothetical protein
MPPGAGAFRVTIHSAVSGRQLDTAVEHHGVGQNTAYVNIDPHLSYLVVDSSNVDWSVTVEEGVTADGQGSR